MLTGCLQGLEAEQQLLESSQSSQQELSLPDSNQDIVPRAFSATISGGYFSQRTAIDFNPTTNELTLYLPVLNNRYLPSPLERNRIKDLGEDSILAIQTWDESSHQLKVSLKLDQIRPLEEQGQLSLPRLDYFSEWSQSVLRGTVETVGSDTKVLIGLQKEAIIIFYQSPFNPFLAQQFPIRDTVTQKIMGSLDMIPASGGTSGGFATRLNFPRFMSDRLK